MSEFWLGVLLGALFAAGSLCAVLFLLWSWQTFEEFREHRR